MIMNKSFENIVKLNEYFSTEDKCRKYLEYLRWNNNPVCPHCYHQKTYSFRDGVLYKCASCRKLFSIKVGTIFEGSKIPLQKWFNAVFLISNNKSGTSSLQLSRTIGVTQKTAWFMLSRIRIKISRRSHPVKKDDLLKPDWQPMLKRVNLSFEEILLKLLGSAQKRQKKGRLRKIKASKTMEPAFPKTRIEFDPETD
jgi:transposase-like protein